MKLLENRNIGMSPGTGGWVEGDTEILGGECRKDGSEVRWGYCLAIGNEEVTFVDVHFGLPLQEVKKTGSPPGEYEPSRQSGLRTIPPGGFVIHS